MDRMSLDLGITRDNLSIIMNRWKYLFIGDCTGDVTIKLGSKSASALDPNEFDKLTEINEYLHMYITNIAQSGKELNIYYEEERTVDTIIEGGKI